MFCKAIMELYAEEFLQKPTYTDMEKLYAYHEEKHGFLGMLGSIDYTDWPSENCPVSFIAQFSRAPDVPFVANNMPYKRGYYLSDGIYLQWSVLIKSIKNQGIDDHKRILYKTKHEAARKDVERDFGVLKKKWKLIKHLARGMSRRRLSDVMYTCIILHNMIIHDNGDAISPDFFREKQHRDDNLVASNGWPFVSAIPGLMTHLGDSISLDGLLPSILLLLLIIVAVAIVVTVILVVVVVGEGSSIIKLSFVIIGSLHRISLVQLLREKLPESFVHMSGWANKRLRTFEIERLAAHKLFKKGERETNIELAASESFKDVHHLDTDAARPPCFDLSSFVKKIALLSQFEHGKIARYYGADKIEYRSITHGVGIILKEKRPSVRGKDHFVDDTLGKCCVKINDLKDRERHEMWLLLDLIVLTLITTQSDLVPFVFNLTAVLILDMKRRNPLWHITTEYTATNGQR
ncbi:ALP1-like protein [Tanacetum coccineum]